MTSMPARTLLTVFMLGGVIAAVAQAKSTKDLIQRHQREKSPVWADGDTATFFYRGQASRVDVVFGGDFRSLERIKDTDIWTLAVKLKDLQQGVFSYQFIPTSNEKQLEKPSAQSGVWRGPRAARAAAECAKLRGKLQQFHLASRSLGTRRKITVYLPPAHDPKKASQVIYAADGEAIDRFARVLEPLIDAGRVPATVLVGVHSGGYVGGNANLKSYDVQKDWRAQEYFPGLNRKRFAEHESFFSVEVPTWAEQRFGVSPRKRDRLVFGYSNGGRFAVEMALRHPDVFGHVLAFSVAGDGKFDLGANRGPLPRFHLLAGTWEPHFHRCTAKLASQMKERGAVVHFSSRVGGHDAALWRDEFAAAVLAAAGNCRTDS